MSFHTRLNSSSDKSDGLVPKCGVVSSNSEKIALVQSSYTLARKEIIQGLIQQLLQDAPHSWICSKDLFNSQTLPPSISVSKFGMEVWKFTDDDAFMCSNGTEVHLGSGKNERELLLRHKFDNGYYYYRACSVTSDLLQQNESELQALVARLVQEYENRQYPDECPGSLTDAMARVVPRALENVIAAKELRVGTVPKTYTISWKKQLVTYIQC